MSLWWQHKTWWQVREGLRGSGVAVQLLHHVWYAHWGVYGEELCYQDQLWTSCMVGLVLGHLRQPCCRFLCTGQSPSCLIFSFGKLCSYSITLVDISFLSSSSLNLFMAGSYCCIFPFPLQRQPLFCSSSKANVFLSHERGHPADLFLHYSSST